MKISTILPGIAVALFSVHSFAEKAVSVSTGSAHTCIMTSTKAVCFGDNTYGQGQVVEGFKNSRQVTSGQGFNCALDDDGVWCWGDNTYGQTDVPFLENVISISAGGWHTCAITQKAGMKCWGYNGDERVVVPEALKMTATAVEGGLWHNCAIVAGGNAACWAYNGYGQAAPPSDLKNVRILSATYYFSCAVDDSGVRCWGQAPANIPAMTNITALAVGEYHGCAVSDGTVKCWGSNNYHQIDVPSGMKNVTALASKSSHTCAIFDGGVKCWGANGNKQTDVPNF